MTIIEDDGHVLKIISTLSLSLHHFAVLMWFTCFTYTLIISGAARRVLLVIVLHQSLLLILMIYRMIV